MVLSQAQPLLHQAHGLGEDIQLAHNVLQGGCQCLWHVTCVQWCCCRGT